jgi:citrate lyase subunit beta/citryl-CoA lyase
MANRIRRTMMFMPGNKPKMLNHGATYGANCLILDLEDAIAVNQKDAARNLVAFALRELDFPCEIAIRPNHISTPFGWDDLKVVVPAKPDIIRLPKVESPEEIKQVSDFIDQVEAKEGFAHGTIKLMAAIETVKGMRQAYHIATASSRMVGLAIGGEDYITDLQTQRTDHGMELFYGRCQLISAAREAGIQAIDTVYSNINNLEGFREEVTRIRDLGFDGKSVVHPSQIEIVNEVFTPTDDQIRHSLKVVDAAKEAADKGIGVITVNGKMIDGPLITRAERVIAQALASHVNVEALREVGEGGK